MEYLNSIISGIVIVKIGRQYIYVKPASAEDKTFADFFSQEQHDDALIDGIWTQQDAEEHLILIGHWKEENDKRIEEIEKNIENMKVDYFNHFYDSTTKNYIKKNIEKQNENYNDLYNAKYAFYDKTCEYLKRYSFISYLLQKNTYFSNGELASNTLSMQIVYNKYNTAIAEIGANIRKTAKDDNWRSRWFALKHEAFANDPSSLTDFQMSLISWSSYYDGIYQSMDKPSDEIIEDDIALDGWSITQRRKRKEEEKQKNAEKMLPEKMNNAGEIFIPARTAQQASDIMNLNNREALSKIKSLKQDLKEHGVVEESQLTSTRRELQMQAVEMSKNRR